MAEVAYNVYDTHVTRTGGNEIFHKLPGVHSHGWYHQWDAAGNDSITFTGTRIRLYAVKYAHHGIATVSIDGGAATDVDLYSADTVASTTPVWDSGVLVSDTHTVVWSWSGRKNATAVTDTYAVVLDWFDILPPPNANPIATGNFGTMTGRTTAVTGGYSAQVRYAADARNYLDFIVNILTSGTSTVAINAVLDGVSTIGGDTTWTAPYHIPLPTGLGQAYIKVVAREAGNYKIFEVWTAPSAAPTEWVSAYLSLPLFALMGTNQWSNPYALGSGYAWTDVAAADAIVPSPPNTEWYAKNFETSLDGAYGRVTMLGTDGLPTTSYSNGVDGNDSLVSVDTSEYFDPTSTLAQINSCQFSIHTPFTKETPQTTIAAFLATFAQDQPFEVERGWMTVVAGVEYYDIVTMGRFFVTDATLDKNQWILNVSAQDGMGLLLDAAYLNSPYGVITIGPYPDDPFIPLPPGDAYVPLLDTEPPSQVTGLTASNGNTTSSLTWDAATDNVAVVGYAVYEDSSLLATLGGDTLTYAATGLTNGTTYSFTVAARDIVGNWGAESDAVEATPVALEEAPTPQWVVIGGAGAGSTGVGVNDIATSPDGTTWTGRTSQLASGYGVAWNGSLWVAVGIRAGGIATSPDGVTWTGRTSPLTTGYGVAWNGSLWVAVGYGTYTTATSPDGITWTGRANPIVTGRAVAWNGSLWVAVGLNSGDGYRIATSPDGVTWTGRTSPFSTGGYDIAWNGSLWVAVGYGTYTIATSPDGLTWTHRRNPLTTGRGVAWNGSLWVAIGDNTDAVDGVDAIATSPNGTTWTGRTSPFTSTGRDVAWNGSLWVAVGKGYDYNYGIGDPNNVTEIATSPDGTTWTVRASPFADYHDGYGVAYCVPS